MSNRLFWSYCVALTVAGSFAIAGFSGPGHQPAAPAASSLASNSESLDWDALNPDEYVAPPGPGHSVDWYKQNFVKPASPLGSVAACFAPGTPMDTVNFVENLIYGGGPNRFFLAGRWPGSQGAPLNLTWSLAPDGVFIPSGVGEPGSNNILFATMDAKFAAQGGRAKWILRIQQVFDRWALLTGLSYTRVTFGGNDWDDGAAWGTPGAAGLRGDLRISSHPIDGASTILAYNNYPASGGDMVLDSDDNWAQGGVGIGTNRFFRNVLAHEHGHGMGLQHVCPANETKLMEPFVSNNYDGPRHDDMRAAMRHYGDDFEDNNTSGTASNLGTVNAGAASFGAVPAPISGLAPGNSSLYSIDADGEVDYWKFHINGPLKVSVTITPQGEFYADYAQDANCNNAVQNTNSLTVADLAVDLVDTNGVSVLGSASGQPVGVAETIASTCLPASGDYFIRVYETNAPSTPQMYTISITATCDNPVVDPIANASTLCGAPYGSGSPSATSCGGVTWSLGGSPPVGMTINPASGVVSWPIPIPSLTPYTVQVQATNSCGIGSQSYSLTVLPGDFDGNGILDDLDVQPLADHILGVSNVSPCAADVNMDGFIDGADVSAWTDLAL